MLFRGALLDSRDGSEEELLGDRPLSDMSLTIKMSRLGRRKVLNLYGLSLHSGRIGSTRADRRVLGSLLDLMFGLPFLNRNMAD